MFLLATISQDEYESAKVAVPPKASSSCGFLAGEPYSDHVCLIDSKYQPDYRGYFTQSGKFYKAKRPMTPSEFYSLSKIMFFVVGDDNSNKLSNDILEVSQLIDDLHKGAYNMSNNFYKNQLKKALNTLRNAKDVINSLEKHRKNDRWIDHDNSLKV